MMVFEAFTADQVYAQRQRQKALDKYYGRGVIAPPPGRVIPPEYKAPEQWHRPVEAKGTGNRHALFTRTPETAKSDREALALREIFNLSYEEIAREKGWKHPQRAWDAVARAQKDRLLSGEDSVGAEKVPLAHLHPRSLPPIDLTTIGIPVRYKGTRICGCYLRKGDRVTLMNKRQVCLDCALQRQGLTWGDIHANPALISRLNIPVVRVPGVR